MTKELNMLIDDEKEMLEFFEEEECMNEDLKKGMNWILSRKGWLVSNVGYGKGSCRRYPNMIRFSTTFTISSQKWEMLIDYDLDNKTWNLDVDVCGTIIHYDLNVLSGLTMTGYKDFDSFLKDYREKFMEWYRKSVKAIELYNMR